MNKQRISLSPPGQVSRYHLLTQKIIRTNPAQEITCCNPTPGIIWRAAQKCWVDDWNQTHYFFNADLLSAGKKALSKNVMQKGLKCLGLLHLLIFQKISPYETVTRICVIQVSCWPPNANDPPLSPAAPALLCSVKPQKFTNCCPKDLMKDKKLKRSNWAARNTDVNRAPNMMIETYARNSLHRPNSKRCW